MVNLNFRKDLVQWLPVCGDFQLQEAILEIAVYMSVTTTDKLSTIKKWFANKDYESAVDSISLESLSPVSSIIFVTILFYFTEQNYFNILFK